MEFSENVNVLFIMESTENIKQSKIVKSARVALHKKCRFWGSSEGLKKLLYISLTICFLKLLYPRISDTPIKKVEILILN